MSSESSYKKNALAQSRERSQSTLDKVRITQYQKRKAKGFNSARENLSLLCDPKTFQEYGQFAVAAQRQRRDYESLKSSTAADGVITGVGSVNEGVFDEKRSSAAIIINDYSVLAGTQGYFHHLKLDRIFDVAKQKSLPIIMFTEGGGGRPGDTDVTTINSGLQ